MKKLIPLAVAFASLLMVMTARAQTSGNRAGLLQNSKNMVVSTADGQRQFFIVNAQQRYTVHRLKDSLVIGRDTFSKADISSLRFQTIERFAVDEENTDLGLNSDVEAGLLAFRRSMNVGRWNTIVLPFSLSAEQVRDAFGADALVAQPASISEGDAATVEFTLVNAANDRDIVIEQGKPYLIRPTKEPDVAEGSRTTVNYGNSRIAGPVYLIDRVSFSKNDPKTVNPTIIRSDSKDTYVHIPGSFTATTVTSSRRPVYLLNDEGRFGLTEEETPINGFRTWIEVSRNTNELPMRFFINGIEEDLTLPTSIKTVNRDDIVNDNRYYDLQGRRVSEFRIHNSELRKGIYVVGGKKVVIR